MILLAGIASAATVAVLDFDGYGVSFTDAQTVTQGVRDAFLGGGALDPLSGSDIADGVSRGQDADLRRARELVAEARRQYAAGKSSDALGPVEEAIELHRTALSDVGRRPELADAIVLDALCLLKAGRKDEARARFGDAVALVPHYVEERGTRMPTDAAALLTAAEDAQARGAKKARTAEQIGHIAEALQVDFVVTGWLNGAGNVTARLYDHEGMLVEASVELNDRPPLPIDAAYNDLAGRLAAGSHGSPAEPEEPEVEEPDPKLPPPDFEEGDPPPSDGKVRPTKIRTTGTMHYDRPVYERWWFWTGIVGVAGGGAFGIWYALSEPPVEYQEEPNSWALTVVTE